MTPPRWSDDDDDPLPIGADPERPATQPGRGRATPASRLAQRFESQWDLACRRNPRLAAVAPTSVTPRGNQRAAFYSWLKNSLLKPYGQEKSEAIIDHFCELVGTGVRGYQYEPKPGQRAWSIFGHLSSRLDAVEISLRQSGWLPERERLAKVEAYEATVAERDEIQDTRAQERASYDEAKGAWEAAQDLRWCSINTDTDDHRWLDDVAMWDSTASFIHDAPSSRRKTFEQHLLEHPDEAESFALWLRPTPPRRVRHEKIETEPVANIAAMRRPRFGDR